MKPKTNLKTLIFCLLAAIVALNYFFIVPAKVFASTSTTVTSTVPAVSPNPADTSITVSGSATGEFITSGFGGCPGFGPTQKAIQESGPTAVAQNGWSIASTALSGTFTLTQTQVGADISCPNGGNSPSSSSANKYSYSFTVNVSSLPNGPYTITVSVIGQPGPTSTQSASFTVSHPVLGTITVSTNNAGASWSFPGSAGNPCGTCSGTSQTYSSQTGGGYNFSANAIAGYSVAVTSSASGGSSCSSGSACTLAGGGQINFTATYTPTTGIVTVSTNNASSTWTFPGSAGNPCGTCSGTAQTYNGQPIGAYNFSAGSIYANSESSTSSGLGGSTCSSGTACNLAGSGQVSFTATYTATTCTVKVQGLQNGSIVTPTNQSFTVSGPSTVNATNSSATQTYTLPSDSSGTNYTFTVNSPAAKATVNGYTSDYTGINAANLSCTPGQTITFTIGYKSEAVLQVQ